MNHYEVRALEIALEVWPGREGFDKANSWIKKADDFSKETEQKESVALLIETLPQNVGIAFQNRNGNMVYAIIRNQKVKTIIVRRNNQNHTPSAFSVDRVVRE